MALTLYKMDESPPVRAVYMMFNVLGIQDVKCIEVDLFKKEHLKESFVKINPQHTIPTLIDDGFIIWDSHAIALYLIGLYAKDDSLYPRDPKIRAVIDQRLHFDTGVLFPPVRNAVRPMVFFEAKSISPETLEEIKTAYDLIEKLLTADWIAGDKMTVADICCVATTSTLDLLLKIDPETYPKTTSWLKRCSELEFYKKGNEPGLKQCENLLASCLTK